MSALKVFISSTCYDLGNVRDGLRDFISYMGYEPIMSEYGDVLYDPRVHTHTSCIEEVAKCDILVLIIGGRFGGNAVNEAVAMIDFEKLEKEIRIENLEIDNKLAITHVEVLKAIECGMPIYTFVEEDVLHEHKLYEKNKKSGIVHQITFPSIEKQETAKYIFEFINVVRLRNHGNNLFMFKKESDIENTLKKQWSSYFQKLLKEQVVSGKKEQTLDLEKKVNELERLILNLTQPEKRENHLEESAESRHNRILWVDDYPMNNEIVRSFFEEQGIQFDIALTTEQGLDFYKKRLYDIIITDMGRGAESNAGITLIKKLNSLCCKIPIVVYCSRQAVQRYGEEARNLGAYRVINGMYDISSLLTSFYRLTDKK